MAKSSNATITEKLRKIVLSEEGQKAIQTNWNTSQPSLYLMLDIVLTYMSAFDYSNNGIVTDYHLVNDLKFENISEVNIRQCLTKLTKDGYAGELDQKDIKLAPHKISFDKHEYIIKTEKDIIPGYFITVEGINFLKAGGYSSKKNRFNNFIKIHWFNVVSTIFVAGTLLLTWVNSNDKNEINKLDNEIVLLHFKIDSLQNNFNYILIHKNDNEIILNTKIEQTKDEIDALKFQLNKIK